MSGLLEFSVLDFHGIMKNGFSDKTKKVLNNKFKIYYTKWKQKAFE